MLLESGEVVLTWVAEPSRRFQDWIPIPMIVSSDSGDFSFIDDGFMNGELSEQRYYRLREVE